MEQKMAVWSNFLPTLGYGEVEVFFNRLGEFRIAAIVLWNTIYLDRAIATLQERGQTIADELLAHLSPLKWEHINLTGDYHWRKDGGLQNRELRPLRSGPLPLPTIA